MVAVAAGVVLWLAVLGQQDAHVINISTGPEGCVWGAPLECSVPAAVLVGSIISVACVVVYGALFAWYIWSTWRALHAQLYQRFRLWHMLWQIQVCTSADARRPGRHSVLRVLL
jgi:hypothetical protein